MRRLLVLAVALLGLPLGPATAVAAPKSSCAGVRLAAESPSDKNPDGSRVRMTPDSRGKYVPVVMVHGWTGTPDQFTHKIDLSTNRVGHVSADRSLIGQLQRIPGVAVFTFDYHQYSARWVDDNHIGPALGEAIDCLYRTTGEKVVVVAHSMGGLATRYALGAPGRASEVSTVVTFGTPETGSLIAGIGGAVLDHAPGSVAAALRLILATCGAQTTHKLDTGTPCDVLGEQAAAADSAAGRALRSGSKELAALAPFPRSVAVHALAGDNVLVTPKIGWFGLPFGLDEVPVGDLVVTADSATHGARDSKVATCRYELDVSKSVRDAISVKLGLTAKNDVPRPLTDVQDPCYHGNLMRTIDLTNEATGIVDDDVTARQPKTEVVTVVPVDKAGNARSGYQVLDDGQGVDCDGYAGYPSLVSVGHDIVSCGATADATDVCWIGADRSTLLCGWNPWDRVLHRNHADAPVRSIGKPDGTAEPWGLELDNGMKCRIRNGGSWSGRSDDYVGAYSCNDDAGRVILEHQDGSAPAVDRSTPQWTVKVGVLDDGTHSPTPVTQRVTKAYFAGSP